MVSAGSVLVNIALNITLVRTLGYRGLALGTSITAIINASVQLFLLRREIHGIEGARIAASFARVMVASAVMGAVTWGAHELMLGVLPGDGADAADRPAGRHDRACPWRRWRRSRSCCASRNSARRAIWFSAG